MIQGSLAFYAHQVQSPRVVVVLLHLHGPLRGEQQVVKIGVRPAFIGREHFYVAILAGGVIRISRLVSLKLITSDIIVIHVFAAEHPITSLTANISKDCPS